MKALINFSIKNGNVDLNGSCLYSDGRTQRGICSLSEKGYKSKKSIFVDFITTLRVETFKGKQCIILTDSEYNELMKLPSPSDPNIKVWNKWKGDDKATIILELCKRMYDPYDMG